MPKRKKLIIALLTAGFAVIEFPGILVFGRMTKPEIFGFPFLYGFMIICWAYMMLVFFYAWRTGWGKHPFTLHRVSD